MRLVSGHDFSPADDTKLIFFPIQLIEPWIFVDTEANSQFSKSRNE
jgi:hypothetical protein